MPPEMNGLLRLPPWVQSLREAASEGIRMGCTLPLFVFVMVLVPGLFTCGLGGSLQNLLSSRLLIQGLPF